MPAARRVLVTGGVRSGKSRVAESLFVNEAEVTYVAPGLVPDPALDPEWAARIDRHRQRRPATWTTVETADVAAAIRRTRTPVLVDDLGTWVTRTADDRGLWDSPRAEQHLDDAFTELVEAWRLAPGLTVAVTSEVGWGLVSEHRSGRLFTDLLGRLNQQIAAASDEVILVVAGRALRL